MKSCLLGLLLLLYNYHLVLGQPAVHRTTGRVTINFIHVVDGQMLSTDSTYSNAFGESYTVSKFRYYVSNISFSSQVPGVKPVAFDTCFLIDEMRPESKQLTLEVPEGRYDKISFLLGVDSLKNSSGAQSGALDPLMDMFWTWNTGYVMAKLEGTSPVSKLPRRMIEYHIGGFFGQHNVLKHIDLHPKDKVISIAAAQGTQVAVEANINTWFNGAHALRIAGNPACTSMGELARQFSDNYSKMFTIVSIVSE